MLTQGSQQQLATLGFSPQWLDYGLLTPESLAACCARYETSEDKHPEHYRYGAFRSYLDGRTHLTDEELANYLQLTLADADSPMGGAAAKDLFTEVNLTDQQFATVCETIEKFPGDWTGRLITRQQLLRRIEKAGLTAPLFEECLEKGDSAVQKLVLETADVNQLRKLANAGITKAVRNMASEKLNRLSSIPTID